MIVNNSMKYIKIDIKYKVTRCLKFLFKIIKFLFINNIYTFFLVITFIFN